MKRFGKSVSVALVAVLFVLSLGGCGTEQAQDVSSDGRTIIRVWTGDTGSRLLYEQAVEEFNETIGMENGIQVVYEAKENLGQTMTVALQTHQAPELFMAGSVAEYAEQGYITPLDDLPGGKELIEKYKDYLVEETQVYKGKTYSIPYAANTYALIYNKDLFKAAGIVDENGEAKPPETFAELRDYARRLTDARNGNYGIAFPLKWSGMFNTDFMNAVLASSGSTGYDFTTGEYDFSCYKALLDTIMQIKEDQSYMPGAEGLDNDPARSRFAEGNIGMKFAVSWDVGVLNTQFPAKCDWGVAPLPVENKGEQYYQKMNVNTGFKISSEAVDKVGADKIMVVYNWLVSEDMAKRIYELGGNLPLDASIVDQVDDTNLPKGWKEFADLLKISTPMPKELPYDISGEVSFDQDFLNNVWPGNKTVDQAIADANRIYNAGAEKYQSLHSDMDVNSYIMPDYSRLR